MATIQYIVFALLLSGFANAACDSQASPDSLLWLAPTYYMCDLYAGNPITCPNGTYITILVGNVSGLGNCDAYGNVIGNLTDFTGTMAEVNSRWYYTNSHIYPTMLQSICSSYTGTDQGLYVACSSTCYATATYSNWSSCYGCYANRTYTCSAELSTTKCYVGTGDSLIDFCNTSGTTNHTISVSPAFCQDSITRTCYELGGSCRYGNTIDIDCSANCTGLNSGCYDYELNKAVTMGCNVILGDILIVCDFGSCNRTCLYSISEWSPCSTGIMTRSLTCLGQCLNGTCPYDSVPLLSKTCSNSTPFTSSSVSASIGASSKTTSSFSFSDISTNSDVPAFAITTVPHAIFNALLILMVILFTHHNIIHV